MTMIWRVTHHIVVHSLVIVCFLVFLSLLGRRKNTAVSRSNAEAKLRAMTLLPAEVTWLRWLLEDFGVSASTTTPLLSDGTKVLSALDTWADLAPLHPGRPPRLADGAPLAICDFYSDFA